MRQVSPKTLATLKEGEGAIEVTQESLRALLVEVFDLRWQNRVLQARNTELVMENRELKRPRPV